MPEGLAFLWSICARPGGNAKRHSVTFALFMDGLYKGCF